MDGKPFLAESLTIEELDDVISQELMPPDELRFDCRGTLHVTKSKFAFVDIGEINSNPKFGTGIAQLGLRLSVVTWLLGIAVLYQRQTSAELVISLFLNAQMILHSLMMILLNLQLSRNGATACMCTVF